MDKNESRIPFERAFKRLRVDGEIQNGEDGSSSEEELHLQTCRDKSTFNFISKKYQFDQKSSYISFSSNNQYLKQLQNQNLFRKSLNNHNNQTNKSNSNTELAQNCSHQARNEPDVTVDELAAYLDLQLYLPKKMSFMAELMYT